MESSLVFLKHLTEEYKQGYQDMVYAQTPYKKAYTKKVLDNLWKIEMSEKQDSFAIIERSTGNISGFCMINEVNTDHPSLGIDMLDDYTGRGYAQAAIKLLIQYAFDNYSMDALLWKADRKNMISRHIAEKMGGILIKEEPTLSQDMVDLGIRVGAFKEEDINYICTYRVERM